MPSAKNTDIYNVAVARTWHNEIEQRFPELYESAVEVNEHAQSWAVFLDQARQLRRMAEEAEEAARFTDDRIDDLCERLANKGIREKLPKGFAYLKMFKFPAAYVSTFQPLRSVVA